MLGCDQITEHFIEIPRGGLYYLAAGPEDGPLIVFVHGWPELSISWRHQLPTLGALGFRAVAVDMPGFGGSTTHPNFEDFSLENLVADFMAFQDSLGRQRAIWVGHDMGSPVVWSIASHHPDRCYGVSSLCVPYRTVECGFDKLVSLVDREIYGEQEHPFGHWDYMKFYEENFDDAVGVFDAHPEKFFKATFSGADPSGAGKPLITAGVRNRGGWFGHMASPPEADIDKRVVDPQSLSIYVAQYKKSGFRGPCSHYMNEAVNRAYTDRAHNGGVLDIPVLFIRAEYDHWCECIKNDKFAGEMIELCRNLTSVSLAASHWVSQEAPVGVNSALVHWLARSVDVWPNVFQSEISDGRSARS